MSDTTDAWWDSKPQATDEERWADCPKHQYAASEVQAFMWACDVGSCRHCDKPKTTKFRRPTDKS